MGIGAYRHLVTLAHPAVVLDPPTWYCSLQSAASQVIDGQAAYFVRGRYHPGLTLETQIHFEGRTFQVQGVTDLDERHVDVQLLCVEVVGRGTTPGVTAPTITTQPQDATAFSGESVTLTVVAAGTPPLAYQWIKAGVDIDGATNASYNTGPLSSTASYAVVVSNPYGSVTSTSATVTVELSYQQQILADGAVAYWPLDDAAGSTEARDAAGARTGTLYGATSGVAGLGGETAVRFTGINSGLLVPPLPSQYPTYSYEIWARPTAATGPNYSLLMRGPQFAYGLFAWQLVRNPQVQYALNEVSSQSVESPTPTPQAVWNHLALTFDGTVLRLYLNGVLDTSGAFTAHPQDGGTLGTGIGCRPVTSGPPAEFCYMGDLQDVAIYARVLTPAEIAAHYTLRTS
jgi:hypothetical protein